jgi:DNA modification methylase
VGDLEAWDGLLDALALERGVLVMTPFVSDPDFTLYVGDALEVLRELPAESVHCALTSPPFYALRDYGMEGQIGLEASPEEWAARLVDVFREVRRVLRPDGTLWVECGDSYNTNGGGGTGKSTLGGTPNTANPGSTQLGKRLVGGLKPKDLLGQPWLLAFALRADGWWLRQTIIWHKPNAMPESATDRCTTSHSYVFLLSKSARYHFDAEAIAEPAEWARWGDQTVPKHEGTPTAAGWIKPKTKAELVARGGRTTNGKERTTEMRGFDNRLERADGMKNPRSVWTIPTQGYPEAHFATWPEALVERILKAGCPEGGVCLDPFMGSGTTALVARKLGRRSIGIELSPEYATLAAKRLQQQSLFAEIA